MPQLGQARKSAETLAPQASLRILAAEDVATNQMLLRHLLTRDGHEVTIVANGEEAVEAVIAAMENDKTALMKESADVLYHLLVALKARDVSLAEVEALLETRTKKSGLEEKAARPDK